MAVALVLFVGFGVLLVLLGVPLALRLVRPNLLYGVRLRQTLEDPDVWYGANAYIGRFLVGAGIVAVIAAVVLYFLGLSLVVYASIGVAVVVGLAIALLLLALGYLRRLAA